VPLGIIGVGLAIWIMNESKDTTSHPTVDWAGVFIVTMAMASLTYALIEGQSFGWTSATILSLFAATALLLILFFFTESKQRQPLIDIRLFRNRTFTAGNIAGVSLMFGFLGVIFLLTLYLQVVLEFSPMKAGLVTTPASGMVLLTAPLAGRFSDKWGSKWLVAVGLFLTAIGVFFLSQISLTTTWQSLMIPLAIVGMGVGLAMAPLTSAVMSTVAPEKSGNASGILSTSRQLGALLGIAVLGAVLQNRLVAGLLDALRGLQLPDAIKQQIEAQLTNGSISMTSGISGGAAGPTADMMKHLFQQELVHAMNVTFLVGVAMMVLGGAAALFMQSHVMPVEEQNPAGKDGSERSLYVAD
jgi:EmrB/QacA subfamily drug resistance transporter